MDAVELNYPLDVSKLMGSEGFVRGARVTEDCKPLLNSSSDCCTASLRHTDETDEVNNSESASASWNKIRNAELWRHCQLPICQAKDLSVRDYGGTNRQLPNTSSDVVNGQRKAGKMPRSISGSSKKRARVEDTTIAAVVDDVKDITDKLGSYSTKFNFPDKTQMSRQKNFSGKRGDKKNFKLPMKPKFDIFSLKTGLASFNVASGLYGLKSDINDVTKIVEDLSLNELLDGNYQCPILGREKGKKSANSTENFLHSLKKACSILLLPTVQSQSFADTDNCHRKTAMYPVSSVSLAASCVSGDKEDTCSGDASPCNKTQGSCGKPEMPASPPAFQLCQPKDILERLALPPSKDLDTLLLDASKPSSSTRNSSDTRSCKQVTRRASLPPFPWSHAYNGNCRTNSDAVKLLSSKSMCQGRWMKIPCISNLPRNTTGCFTNLESLAFDPSLIPSVSKSGNTEGGIAMSTHNHWFVDQGSASLATNAKFFNVPQVGQHSPRLLAAAQTLYDMAPPKSSRQNLDEIARWPKKQSQKAVKARKTKSIEKPNEVYATASLALRSDKPLSDMDQIIPWKRPKLSVVETKKDLNHINGIRKGPITWSTPKSSRSSPGKSLRDSTVEIRHSTANAVKSPCSMPPPATPSDKFCNSQHKLRKLMPGDWKRG